MSTEPRFKGNTSFQRSNTMSHIRGKDTSIELKLRKSLWHNGIRYRKQYKIKTLGRRTIDIAITKYNIAIFCDSEFFHGKDWDNLYLKLKQGNNPDYWIKKIQHNKNRDLETDKILRSEGWVVLRFWQKDIDNNLEECVKIIKDTIFEQKLKFYEKENYDQ